MRLGILVSGRGSNLAAVLKAVADGRLAGIDPVIVVSNRAGVPALDIAERHAVPSRVLRQVDFAGAEERDAAIGLALTEAGAELALLAGYDRLLHRSYFDAFAGRTINIHPSLLPRHGGPGMMGLAVHAAVLAAGDEETGVTIHEVTADLDAGPPIRQESVPVVAGEPAQALADRVLEVEHRVLVEELARMAARTEGAESSASMTAASPAATNAGAPHERLGSHA